MRRSPKPGRLDRGALERPADLVDDERGQGLALDILGDDQERLAHLGDLLEEGHHVLHGADLLFVQQDIGIFEVHLHLVGIGDEVGGDVAPVELHPLDDLQGGLHPLGLLDGDHPLLADLLHRLGDHLPDGLVVVRRDGADLGDLLLVADLFGHLLQLIDDQGDPLFDPALQGHGVHAGNNELGPLAVDRLGEDRGRRGAVTGLVRGLGGHLLDHLCPHVLELVLQFDLLGDGDAVLGDLGGTPGLGDDDVAPLGAQGDLDRVGQGIDALHDLLPGLHVVFDFLCRHVIDLLVMIR